MTSQHVLSKTKNSAESRRRQNRKHKNEEKKRGLGRLASVRAMGSSYRTASSRQRESRSPPGSEIKDRNTWGVQDITGITYRACEETRRAHTQVKARAWKASSPAPSAPAGPSSRASTARMYLGCFDRQTAFSISVSVLVVPWGASDLSSSTPDPTHAP